MYLNRKGDVMRTYNLHIGDKHLLNEALNEIRGKRNILIEGETIEEVDKRTALFPSFIELEEELNEVQGPNDTAVILLLDEYNKGIKIVTSDIVYTEDLKQIKDKDSIKAWALDYLRKNPSDIVQFEGIRSAYKTKYGNEDREYSEEKVVSSVYAYFNNANHLAYRKIYFELKAIDPPVLTDSKRK